LITALVTTFLPEALTDLVAVPWLSPLTPQLSDAHSGMGDGRQTRTIKAEQEVIVHELHRTELAPDQHRERGCSEI
jgi:hypothetical protein